MKQFYETYRCSERLSALPGEFETDINKVFKDSYILIFKPQPSTNCRGGI